MQKYNINILFVLFSIFIAACSADKIVLEEMSISDHELYAKFKNERISISTNDSVKVEIKNQKTKQDFIKQKVFKDRIVENYLITSDSLIINEPNFRSVLGFKTIAAIKFKGVYDNELGFVTEAELNDNVGYDFGKPVGGVIGMFGGMIAGGVVCEFVLGEFVGAITKSGRKSIISHDCNAGSAVGVLFGVVAGGILGWNIGSNIGSSGPSKTEDIIEAMKLKRMNKL